MAAAHPGDFNNVQASESGSSSVNKDELVHDGVTLHVTARCETVTAGP